MKQFAFSVYLMLCLVQVFFFASCKKEPKPVTYTGQLFLAKKYPVPLRNKQIEIYQRGAPSAIGINIGSTSSTATGITDGNGYFRLSFTPGESRFFVFSGPNNSPLILGSALGDTTFPDFSRSSFPDPEYDKSKPIYVAKTIDTVVIKASLISDLNITDTIGVQTNTLNGSFAKEYTRLSGRAGTVVTIDTIYNMLLTHYDCVANKFTNSLYAGRKWTTVWGYNTISSEGIVSPYLLTATDETKTEMTFYYKKN